MTKFILLLETRTEKTGVENDIFWSEIGSGFEEPGFSSSRFRVVNNAKKWPWSATVYTLGRDGNGRDREIQLLFFFGILFCSIPSFSFLLYNSYNLLQRIHNYISYSVQHIRQKRESDCPRFELDNAILMVRDFILARAGYTACVR